MTRPTSMKIFGQKYTIRYDYENPDEYGVTNQATNTIHLRGKLPEDKLIRVFMHEVTHAVIFETPLSLRKRFDLEEVCDIVGFHILDAIKDNPKVLAWVMQDFE